MQSVALVMLVLDTARQRAAFVRSFNQTLLDAMDTGLVLVGTDRRILRANRWMSERWGGELGGRTCFEAYLDQREPCAACPWRDGEPAGRQLTADGGDGRQLLIHASPLAAPDASTVLLELVRDVTAQEALRARAACRAARGHRRDGITPRSRSAPAWGSRWRARSCRSMRLPHLPPEGDRRRVLRHDAAARGGTGDSTMTATVLAIDDDPQMLEGLGKLLRKGGHGQSIVGARRGRGPSRRVQFVTG